MPLWHVHGERDGPCAHIEEHLQQCISLDYIFPMFSNCNATHRTRRPGPPGAFRTNGPRRRECTVANNGQQRPPFEHTRRVSGPVHSMSALTRSPATEHIGNSSYQVIRQRAHRTPSGGNSAATPTPTPRQRDSESPSSQQSTSPPNFPVPVQGPPGLLIIGLLMSYDSDTASFNGGRHYSKGRIGCCGSGLAASIGESATAIGSGRAVRSMPASSRRPRPTARSGS